MPPTQQVLRPKNWLDDFRDADCIAISTTQLLIATVLQASFDTHSAADKLRPLLDENGLVLEGPLVEIDARKSFFSRGSGRYCRSA